MGRGAAIAAIAVIAAFAAGPAPAASTQVAGPTPSGATLRAHHEGFARCIDLLVGRSHIGNSCGGMPRRAADTLIVDGSDYGSRSFAGLMAPHEVARIQVVQRDGATTDVPAASSPAEPDAAFFLAEVDRKAHGAVMFVRLFDADGAELAALTGDASLAPSRTVTVGRSAGLRVVAYDAREFEPSPVDLERVRHYLCVSLRLPHGHGSLGEGCIGRETVPAAPLIGIPMPGDCHYGNAVAGFASRRVARMELVLGNGARVTGRPRNLPLDPPAGRRIIVVVAPPSAAIRRAEAFDSTGRRVATIDLGIAPPTDRCAGGDLLLAGPASGDTGPAGPTTPPPAGSSTLAVRVDGDRLCVGVDTPPPAPRCWVPVDDAVYAEAEREYADGSRGFAGLVDPHVTTVQVRLAGGRRVNAPTTPPPVTAGPYQAISRGYVIHVKARVLELRYYDSAGHLLYRRPADAGLESVRRPRVVLRAGATRLAVSRWRPETSRGEACAELLVGGEVADSTNCELIDRRFATAVVSCTTRRIAIYGRLGRTPRSVEAITATGRHVTGIVDRASRAFLVVLAPGEGLHELHVIGRRGYRTALDLPAGADQCGYEATLFGPF